MPNNLKIKIMAYLVFEEQNSEENNGFISVEIFTDNGQDFATVYIKAPIEVNISPEQSFYTKDIEKYIHVVGSAYSELKNLCKSLR